MHWGYSWYKINLTALRCVFLFLQCQLKDNSSVYGVFFPPFKLKVALFDPTEEMYICGI